MKKKKKKKKNAFPIMFAIVVFIAIVAKYLQ
jgi:predicted nucleic acid-binding Zn ribbon protein